MRDSELELHRWQYCLIRYFLLKYSLCILLLTVGKILERMHAVFGHATKNNKVQDHDDLGLETSDTKVCHWK